MQRSENKKKNNMGIDYTNGDHSFKNWFKIMWANSYIQLFLVAVVILFIVIFGLPDQLWVLTFPITMMGVIIYKGFYQFWKDLINGRSR